MVSRSASRFAISIPRPSSSSELIGESERASEEGRERECGRRARAAAVVFLVGHNEEEERKGEREGGRPWGPLTVSRENAVINRLRDVFARAHTNQEPTKQPTSDEVEP